MDNDVTPDVRAEHDLVAAAAEGEESAFAELLRRHSGPSWRLAVAVTGDAASAAVAVREGFATTFTGLRTGRLDATTAFRAQVLIATRNAATDLGVTFDDVAFADEAIETRIVAEAFATLPERARTGLWLTEVEGLRVRQAAGILQLTADEASKVVARGRRSLRTAFLRAHLRHSEDRNCSRSVERLGDHVAGRLPSDQIEKLERHLRLCGACRERYEQLTALGSRLALLVLAMPEDLDDEVRAAWSAAVTVVPGGTGLSRLAERVLAATSAAAAVVSVLGAAAVGIPRGDRDGVAAAPIAPVVTELAAPRPAGLDLRIELDPDQTDGDGDGSGRDGDTGAGGDVVATSADGDATPAGDLDDDGSTPDGSTGGGTGGGSGGGGGGGGGGENPGGGTTIDPLVSVGTNVGGTDVGVQVGGPGGVGVTVGDIQVGGGTTPGTGPVSVGGALDPLDPVVGGVNDVLGGLGL